MTTNIDDYIKHYLMPGFDSVEEKAKKLLQRIREKSDYYGKRVSLVYDTDYPLAYAKNKDEFWAFIKFLDDSGLSESDLATGGGSITLSALGWDVANKMKQPRSESNQGFMAIWFDKSMDDSIRAIEDAVKISGYKSMCIRDEHFSEKIMDKALSEIRQSRFIIIDLTGNRNSVFFEAGFAFGLGIEAIYVYKKAKIKEGSSLEFYVKHYQCYGYSEPEELKEILINAIGAKIKNNKNLVS